MFAPKEDLSAFAERLYRNCIEKKIVGRNVKCVPRNFPVSLIFEVVLVMRAMPNCPCVDNATDTINKMQMRGHCMDNASGQSMDNERTTRRQQVDNGQRAAKVKRKKNHEKRKRANVGAVSNTLFSNSSVQ